MKHRSNGARLRWSRSRPPRSECFVACGFKTAGFDRTFFAKALLLLAAAGWTPACSESPAETSAHQGPRVIGTRGRRPGRFSFPRGIDVARDGRIAVADKTGRIQILSPGGEPMAEWVLPKIDNGTPTGLVFDHSDPERTTLIVADTHVSRLIRYSLEGELLAMWGEYGSAPGQMVFPTDVAVDDAGMIYVTEYGEEDRIIKFDSEGGFIKEWGSFGEGPGQFQRPLGLVYLAPDRIVVADTCNHRFQIFDTEGELIAIWGEVGRGAGQFNYPYDLALGEDGILYVAEYGNNRIQSVDLKGRSIALLGEAGFAAGRFATPWGIASGPKGGIYVADTNNHRLQVIQPEQMDFSGAEGAESGGKS